MKTKHMNIEIKARSSNHKAIRKILNSKNADYRGTDNQVDIYFKTNSGKLKLRKGNIENYLIYYERENKKGPKQADVILFETYKNSPLEKMLEKSLGILVKVDKEREIYFIDNIKFHLDTVKGLGSFVEIEAIDSKGTIGKDNLLKQCQFYQDLLGINKQDLISCSYSDLLLKEER